MATSTWFYHTIAIRMPGICCCAQQASNSVSLLIFANSNTAFAASVCILLMLESATWSWDETSDSIFKI